MIDYEKKEHDFHNSYSLKFTGWSCAGLGILIFLLGVGLGHVLTV